MKGDCWALADECALLSAILVLTVIRLLELLSLINFLLISLSFLLCVRSSPNQAVKICSLQDLCQQPSSLKASYSHLICHMWPYKYCKGKY